MSKLFLFIIYLFPRPVVSFFLNIFCKIRFLIVGRFSKAILYFLNVNDIDYKLLVSSKDFGVGGSLAVFGFYQKDKIAEVIENLRNVKKALFLGTHVGSFLIPITKYLLKTNNKKSEVTIDGYDANDKTLEILKENLILNNLEKHVNLHNFAVGDKKKKVKFVFNQFNDGGSKIFPVQKKYIYFFDKPVEKEVNMITIDTHRKNVEYDLIIMDLEGSEFLAMKGMPKKMKYCKFFQLEYNWGIIKDVIGEMKLEEMIEMLKESGFNYVKILGEKIIYKKEEFLLFFKNLNRKNKFVDLFFYK